MSEREPEGHLVVAGHLMVDPAARDDYLAGCLDPGRVNVYERWASRAVAEYDVAAERFLT